MSNPVAEKVQGAGAANDPNAVAVLKQLIGMPDTSKQLIGAPDNPAPPAAAPPAAPPAAAAPAAPPAAAAPAAPANVIKTPLGDIPIAKPGDEPVNIATFEDAFKYPEVKNAIGMEVNTPQEFFEKLLPNLQKWRASDAKVGELETKNKNLIESVKMLPEPVRAVITTYYEDAKLGTNNWEAMLSKAPVVDFKQPVEKVEKEVLLNTYYPGKFTPEDIADPDNKAVEIAYESSKQTYTSQRQKRIDDANNRVKQAQLREEAISASIESSVSKFGEGLPIKPDDGRKGQVEQMMRDGSWLSAFVNEDWTFKPDASTKIGLAVHGAETVQSVISSITNQVQSRANEAAVDKADVTKVTGAGGSEALVQNQQAQAGINSLLELMKPEKTHF